MNKRWELDGREVRKMREVAGLSTEQLAQRVMVEERFVHGVENGYQRFKTQADAAAYAQLVGDVCKDAYDTKMKLAAGVRELTAAGGLRSDRAYNPAIPRMGQNRG